MRRRIGVLMVAAMMAVMAAPALAVPEKGPHNGNCGEECYWLNQGTETAYEKTGFQQPFFCRPPVNPDECVA